MRSLLLALLFGCGLGIQATYSQRIGVYGPPGSRDKDGNTFFAIDSRTPEQQLFPAEWFSNLPKGGCGWQKVRLARKLLIGGFL